MLYKKLFLICVLVAVTLISTQFATADYRITNGSATEPAFVVYSRWLPASGNWPAGWRTQGYYRVEPGGTRNLSVPQGNTWVYIYVRRGGSEIKPVDHATRDSAPFWIHPSKSFTVVETDEGDFLRSNRVQWNLEQASLYEYRNGGSHTIADEPRLPDLPANQVYNQTIDSVVWIHAGEFTGSGVLIDRRRKLVVTNQHVVENTVWVDVFFPWRNQNGSVNKNADFYERKRASLQRERYLTKGKVIASNARNDLAIVQLVQIPATAREIRHDFSRNVENSMRQGDTIHIFGHPGTRVWNWTRASFQGPHQVCDFADGTSLVGCLEMEGDTHPGNSGGPVTNGQGTLIGILVGGTDETVSLATPTRNIKALLDTILVNLSPISAPTYPRRVFRIVNRTGVTVPYEIRWSQSDSWESSSLEKGFIMTHTSDGQNILSGYPKIRFDYIAGDGEVTYRRYNLDTVKSRQNNDNAPTYRFEYNQRRDELDLFKGAAPTVYPKRKFKIRNRTGVTMHYQVRWSNSDNWESSSLETGFIMTHTSDGQNILSGYPKIRFDYIAGDGEVTYRRYNLESANANANVAPTYRFEYNQRGDRVDLYRDGSAAPVLSEAAPEETSLLSNYPNPFNPETWIPYQLAKPAEVTVTIYAADGKLVRTLALGHQPAGVYQRKSRAAYWDGRNALGEPVASGVYFYTLKAGDFTATRKMLIRK